MESAEVTLTPDSIFGSVTENRIFVLDLIITAVCLCGTSVWIMVSIFGPCILS